MLFFPVPLPGELLHSILARYAEAMGFIHKRQLNGYFFGDANKGRQMNPLLPLNLGAICEQIPIESGITPEYLLQNHTLYPVYHPFKTIEQQQKWFEAANAKSAKQITSRYTSTEYLRGCPDCVKDDRQKWGKTYWHVVHQINSVFVCPIHGTPLWDSNVQTVVNASLGANYISAEGAQLIKPTNLIDNNEQIFKWLVDQTIWLLSHDTRHLSADNIKTCFQLALKENGFSTPNGRLKKVQFLTLVNRMYSKVPIGQQIAESDRHWALNIVNNHESNQNVLLHLLIIHALGFSISEFLNLEEESFGQKMWPCLNTICKNYRQLVIPRYQLDSKGAGIFKCQCGFTYTRIGPDNSDEDKFNYEYVIDYGDVWKAELKRLWDQESSPEIAIRLGVTHDTLLTQVRSMNLMQEQVNIDKALDVLSLQRITYRKKWLSAQEIYPHANISNLKRQFKFSASYNWLYSNDLEWLENNSPPKNRPSMFPTINNIYPHLRLAQTNIKDCLFAEKIRMAAHEIRIQDSLPIWIQEVRVLDHLQLSQSQKKNREGSYARAISDVVYEPYEVFSIRAMEWVRANHPNLASDIDWMKLANVYETLRNPYRVLWQKELLTQLHSTTVSSISLMHTLLPSAQRNWSEYDAVLANKVKLAVTTIMENEYPIQVNMSTLAVTMNATPQILIHYDMLPLTISAITEVVEADVEFGRRIIDWAWQLFQQKGWYPKISRFANYLALNELIKIPEVERYLIWLYENTNTIIDLKTLTKTDKDLEKRDLRLLPLIQETAQSIRNESGKPNRVTKRAIMLRISEKNNEISFSWLKRQLEKLPRSDAAMDQLVETRLEFAIRRLRYIGLVNIENQVKLSAAKLLEQAHIPKELAQEPQVLSILQKIQDDMADLITSEERELQNQLTQRDMVFVEEVKTCVVQIRSKVPLKRITKRAICKELATDWLIRSHPEKLPQTMAEITSQSETKLDFQMRKLKWQSELHLQAQKDPEYASEMINALGRLEDSIRNVDQDEQQVQESLDDYFCQKINCIIEALIEEEPPVRISPDNIFWKLAEPSIKTHLKKGSLPKTALLFRAEPFRQFAMRRLKWAVKDFHQAKTCPKSRNELIKKASLDNYNDEEFDGLIDNALDELSIYPTQVEKNRVCEDDLFAQEIIEASNSIYSARPPKRVTRGSLGKALIHRKRFIKTNTDRQNYPLTMKALDEVLEEQSAFCLRRLHILVENYQENYCCPTYKQLVYRSGLDPFLDQLNVQTALADAQAKLQVFKK